MVMEAVQMGAWESRTTSRELLYEVMSSLSVVSFDTKIGDAARSCSKLVILFALIFLYFTSLVCRAGFDMNRDDMTAR